MQTRIWRRAEDSDAAKLVALINSAYRGDSGRQGWTTEADLLDGQRIDAVMLHETLRRSGSRIFLLEDGTEIMGCVHLQADGDTTWLGMLTVNPKLQDGGIGRFILEQAEKEVRSTGSTSLQMTVIAGRESLIQWYQRRGFALTGESKPFPHGDTRFGLPKRSDLYFVVLSKHLPLAHEMEEQNL